MSTRLSDSDTELAKKFCSLRDAKDVADLLEVTYSKLTYHIYRSTPGARYESFFIPKKAGGTREITAPMSALKLLQIKLNQVLQAVYRPKGSTHGFVRGRSVLSNAQLHVGREWILNIDLEQFFPTINFGRVRGLLTAKPYNLPPQVATVIAQICCFNNQLPQGAPTSPVIANMICARMDSELRRFAERHRCRYSRYADDLSFSSNVKAFPVSIATVEQSVIRVHKNLVEIIEANGFRVNSQKVRLQHRRLRQEVTGLVVNQRANVPRKYVRQVRAMLRAWDVFEYEKAEEQFLSRWDKKHRNPLAPAPSFRQVIRGKLEYIAMVKGRADPVFINLVNRGRALDEEFFGRVATYEDAIWVLVDNMAFAQGTGFFAEDYGMFTCAHVAEGMVKARRSSSNSKEFACVVVQSSRVHDIAVLSTTAPRLHTLRIGDSDHVRTGDKLKILGYPQWSENQTLQITSCEVTGIRPVLGVNRIAVSTSVIPGNSGGPVLDDRGRVIGVAARGSDSHSPSRESAVIPINAFLRVNASPHKDWNREDAFLRD